MKLHFKYKIGDSVWYIDEVLSVLQLRTDNGHVCYRLSNNRIVSELFLS